jgi:glycosyltransferase involved in cell wall biosynthesis
VPTDTVSVTLGVGGAPYQKTLAANLLKARMLRRVFNTGPYLEIQDPDSEGSLHVIRRYPIHYWMSRISWGIWRRIPMSVRPGPPAMVSVLLTDRLWSPWIPPCDVYHGWMGLSVECFRAAKRQGAVTLLENAGRHPRHWHQAGAEECKRLGIAPRERSKPLPSMLIRRITKEYELCDRIVVPSNLAYRSFAEFGLADKVSIVPTGVDTDFFNPAKVSEPADKFRVCFVGRVELAKGAGYLLQAWKRLALPNAELVMVGSVKPEMNSLMRECSDSTVRTTGVVPPAALAKIYRESDLFAFPSVNEGLAQVLLEAMASGLPIVASDYSGGDDLITEGKEGFIVPARNVDRLAEAILWCYQHRDETRAMGRAARAKIESQFTLDHYSQRQIALYRAVAA